MMMMMTMMINMRLMIVSMGMIEKYDHADDEEGGCHLAPPRSRVILILDFFSFFSVTRRSRSDGSHSLTPSSPTLLM